MATTDTTSSLHSYKIFAVGAVAGAALIAFVGFKSHYIVTNSTMEQAVRQGVIDQFATVCITDAKQLLASRNTNLETLAGWTNSDKRRVVADEVLKQHPIPAAFTVEVAVKCGQDLA